jgi:hypothetical protein
MRAMSLVLVTLVVSGRVAAAQTATPLGLMAKASIRMRRRRRLSVVSMLANLVIEASRFEAPARALDASTLSIIAHMPELRVAGFSHWVMAAQPTPFSKSGTLHPPISPAAGQVRSGPTANYQLIVERVMSVVMWNLASPC